MIGIKTPEVLSKLSQADYRKKLKTALKKFITETKNSNDVVARSYAYFKAFTLKDGIDYPVLIIGLPTHWARYAKARKKEKAEVIIGKVIINKGDIIFETRIQIKFPDTLAERLIRQNKYEKVFESLSLKTSFVDKTEKEQIATGPLEDILKDDKIFAEILELVINYRKIDPEKEDIQMGHLNTIGNLVLKIETNNKKADENKIIAIKTFVETEIQEIEIELKDEAWEDYNEYMSEKSGFESDENKTELDELVYVYSKWYNLFANKKRKAEFQDVMEELKEKIDIEVNEFQENIGEEDNSLSEQPNNLSINEITGNTIKEMLANLRAIPKDDKYKRLKGIFNIEKAIEIYKSKNNKENPGLEKLILKLAESKKEELDLASDQIPEIAEDLDEFIKENSEIVKFEEPELLKRFEVIEELKSQLKDWNKTYSEFAYHKDLETWKEMANVLDGETRQLENVIEVAKELNRLIEKFDNQGRYENRVNVYKEYENMLSRFL